MCGGGRSGSQAPHYSCPRSPSWKSSSAFYGSRGVIHPGLRRFARSWRKASSSLSASVFLRSIWPSPDVAPRCTFPIPDPRSPVLARRHDRGDGARSWHDGRHPEHSRFRRDWCILAQSLERSRLTGARVIVRDDACATAIGNDAPIKKSIITFVTVSIVKNGLRNSGPGCAAPPACPARARRNQCRNWSAFACRGCCWRSGMLRSCFPASRSSR